MKVAHDINVDGDAVVQGQGKFLSAILAPLVVASPILVSNLNSDLLDDKEGSYYLNVANHTGRITDFSRLPTVAENTLVGRYSSGTGDMQQITLGAGFSLPGGVLTYTETDPTVPAHVKGITSGDITNWNTAYGWGDFRDYGLAVPYSLPSGNDLSTIDFTGFVRTISPGTDFPPGIAGNGFVISNYISNVRGQQLVMGAGSDRLFFRRNFNGWQPWVELVHSSNLSSIGSGLFVNTTGNQTGIAGNKQWTGRQQWTFPANAGLVVEARSVQVAAGANGPYVVGFDNNGDQMFTLRTYAASGIQLVLNAGGISTSNHGTSANWYQAYQWGNYRKYGLGSFSYSSNDWGYTDLDVLAEGGAWPTSFIGTNLSNPPGNKTGFTYPFGIHINVTNNLRGDLIISHGANRMAFRSNGRPFTEVLTEDNIASYLDYNNLTNKPTLSLGTNSGEIAISGGNSVRLNSLARITKNDASSILPYSGLTSYTSSDSSVGYPDTAAGSGIIVSNYVESPTNSSYRNSFEIWRSRASSQNKINFRTSRNGNYGTWQTFASEEWTASNYYSKTESDGRYLSALTINGENYLTIDSGSKTLTAGAINLNSTHTSGVLPVTKGGTGLSSLGTAGQFLRVNAGGNALEYYSLPPPVVPDLQAVTDQGATTTNSIAISKASGIAGLTISNSTSSATTTITSGDTFGSFTMSYPGMGQITGSIGGYSTSFNLSGDYGTLFITDGSYGGIEMYNDRYGSTEIFMGKVDQVLRIVNTGNNSYIQLNDFILSGVGTIGQINGHIRDSVNPSHDDDLTRKAYVDNLVKDGTLTLSTGDGLTGGASFSANQATNSTFTVGLSAASQSTIGGVKLFSNTVQSVAANAISSITSRTYGVQVNGSGQLVVNVPWTDNNTTYSGSNGISLSGTVFSPVYGTTAGTIAEGNHVHSIQQLTDVDYMVVADGDVLAYDGIDGIWKPFTLPAFPTNYYTKTESDARYLSSTNKYVSVFNNPATTNSVASLDFNDAPMSTILRAEPAVNSPEGSGLIYTFGDAGSRAYQLFQGHGYNDSFWYRTRLTSAGGWREWLQVSSRSWVSSTHVQKAGDTMTGTLNGTRIILNDQFEVVNPTAPNHKIHLVATPDYTRLNMGYGSHTTFQIHVVENGTTYFVHNIGDGSEQRMVWDSSKNITFNVANRIQVNGDVRYTGQLVSTVATGTAPMSITSTTQVNNLNADLLDGQHGSYYLSLVNATGSLPVTKGGTGLTSVGTNGQLLRSNGTSLEYFTPAFLTSVALGDLTNVTLSTPSNGQALIYNGSAWINSTLPSIPTNYVTTDTNQTGLGGNKTWTGHHIIAPGNTSSPSTVANSVRISRNASGAFTTIENNSAASAVTLRSWNGGTDNKYQISLLTGGIETGNHGNSENWYTAWQRIIPTNVGRTGNGIIANNTTLNSEQAWTDLPIGYSAFVYSNVGVANGAPDDTFGYFTKVANRDSGGGWAGLWIDYNYNAFYVGKAFNNTTFATWSRVLTAYTPTTLSTGQLLRWNGTGWANWTPDFAPSSATVSAGNGLTGGGAISSNPTITLGTPGNITLGSSNSVSTNSHTHAFVPGGTTSQYIRGDGTLATFPAIPTNYVPDTRTLQFTAGSGLSVSGTASTNLSVDRTVTYSLTFGTTAGTVAQGNDSRIVNAVQTSRSINTQHSITGGGNLGSDRTFQLVNDVSSPGANKYYGTNNANVRGWYDLPSTNSFVPNTRTITINGNTQNLSDNRSWTVGDVTGSGQAFTVPLWGGSGSSSKIISNSIMVQDAGRIIVGGNLKVDLGLEVTQTTTLNSSLNVNGVAIFNDIAAFNGFVNMDNSSTQVSAGNLRINGLRSTEITLASSPGAANADTTLYNVFRMNYSSNGAGIQLTGTPKDGSIAILVSQNDTNSFTIRNTVRGSSAVTFSGGTCVLLVRAGSYWYIVGTHDNNW